ncbi:MAG: Zn-dependent hydrolase [Actinomycetota bacterium]|nr:Zn-dependent hydrolase [Actinomycetota bacterium]
MNINRDRLWGLLAEVNEIGKLDSGGAERLAWTQEEIAARHWLVERCVAEGLEASYDEVGNVWVFAGRRPAVMMGSHLDTVPSGGRFDGALGVASALEGLLSAREAREPGWDRLGVLCFTDEEGVRFGLGMTGSRALAGDLGVDELENATTTQGVRLGDVMRHAGFDPERVSDVSARRGDLSAYLEVHVEQGRRLERAGLPASIVTGIVGLSHRRLQVLGEANHAGTTLPADRRDALMPIATAALEAQRVMNTLDQLVATVGEAAVVGGATNIVPGEARATLDVRSLEEDLIDRANQQIIEAARRAAEDNGCELRVQETKRLRAAPMAPEVLEAMRSAASEFEFEVPEMPSMAGHDSMTLTGAGVPCGMVFVRSEGGISHSPKESSTLEDCALGASLLVTAALKLAVS